MDMQPAIEESFEKRQTELYRSMTAEELRAELAWRSTTEASPPPPFYTTDDRMIAPSKTHIDATKRATQAVHARCAELIREELTRR